MRNAVSPRNKKKQQTNQIEWIWEVRSRRKKQEDKNRKK